MRLVKGGRGAVHLMSLSYYFFQASVFVNFKSFLHQLPCHRMAAKETELHNNEELVKRWKDKLVAGNNLPCKGSFHIPVTHAPSSLPLSPLQSDGECALEVDHSK